MVEGSSSEATTGKGPTEAVVTRVVAILNSASATIPKSTLPTASGGADTSPPVGSCAATLGCRRVT